MDRNILLEEQTFGADRYFTGWTSKSGVNQQLQLINKFEGIFDLLGGQFEIGFSHSLAERDNPRERGLLQRGRFELVESEDEDYLTFVNRIVGRGPAQQEQGEDFYEVLGLSNLVQTSHYGRNREYATKIGL